MFTKIIFSGVGAGAGFRKKIPGAGATSKQDGSETLPLALRKSSSSGGQR